MMPEMTEIRPFEFEGQNSLLQFTDKKKLLTTPGLLNWPKTKLVSQQNKGDVSILAVDD